jgi:hypothetical protein
LEVARGSLVDSFLNSFVDAHNSMGHVGRFVDVLFRSELETVGFRIARDELCRYTWDFLDEDTMAEFVRLLFGLDQADRATVLGGLADFLGYRCRDDVCQLNWEMQRLLAD